MDYIVLDIEWNGSYSRKAKGYFNEIIEIGAVKLDEALNISGDFHAVIRPVISRKLTEIVKGLTGIEDEELADGKTFAGAVSRFRKWIGPADNVIMTWSTSDLLVLLENCNYFLKESHIPFLKNYLDLQFYFQHRRELGFSQQVGLGAACDILGIEKDSLSQHRALDDSKLSAEVLRAIFEKESICKAIKPANKEFYERLTFKTTFILDINNPHVNAADFNFNCESCGVTLADACEWKFRGRAFRGELICPACGEKYRARVQVRLKYDGPVVSRGITIAPPEKEEDIDEQTEPAEKT